MRITNRLIRRESGAWRIGRWSVARCFGVVEIHRGPAPACFYCDGTGMEMVATADPDDVDFDPCRCTDGPAIRIRYRPRRKADAVPNPWYSDEAPF